MKMMMSNDNLLALIEKYSSNAPVDVEGLIRALGIELIDSSDLADGIAGQIIKNPDGKFEIHIRSSDHEFRKRFTMAHELGHYLLHRNLIGNGVTDNKAYRAIDTGKYANKSITRQHETEANKFAASLLMPLKRVSQDHKEFCDINKVAGKWQVSPAALRIRLNIQD